MILEVAVLDVRAGHGPAFEAAFAETSAIIAGMPGYISHQLQRCIERQNRYLLLVQWERLEDHTVGFRGSPQYQEWKRRLHHFYDPFPVVEHLRQVPPPIPSPASGGGLGWGSAGAYALAVRDNIQTRRKSWHVSHCRYTRAGDSRFARQPNR